jgi:Xaa-Pro aminopeptidase
MLETLLPHASHLLRLAVNYSVNDVKADGLSHGMYLLLEENLRGTRFENTLVSAESLVMALRGRKNAEELRRMRAAIEATEALFALVPALARPGVSERQIYDALQREIEARGLGFAWERSGDPIVNAGPDSMIGHGLPSADIRFAPGQILHIDLGVVTEGYSSDMQRCWYLPEPGETAIPGDIRRALDAVNGAISAGAAQLKPGVCGWEVDAAARAFLTSAGYPEYLHAFGHQVGRVAHDGGALLGPRWERYGQTPLIPIEENEVYTLELGVFVESRGYLGLEEMVVVTAEGCEWLTERQWHMPLLEPSAEDKGDAAGDDVRIA